MTIDGRVLSASTDENVRCSFDGKKTKNVSMSKWLVEENLRIIRAERCSFS